MNPRRVEVRWLDAYDDGGWSDTPTEKTKPWLKKCSPGFIVYEDEFYISLADIVEGENGRVTRLGHIPKGCILEIVDLEQKRDWPV